MHRGRNAASLVVAIVVIAFGWDAIRSPSSLNPGEPAIVSGKATPTADASLTNAARYPVVIKLLDRVPTVKTGLTNHHGESVSISCGACHATTTPNSETRSGTELDEFHQGLQYNHGNLTCLSCHNADSYDTLRLADSRPVTFRDAMTLCSQCHGPQRRDYDMGLHGGMTGYWDLTRGGRTRNSCIHCHDPHTPAFPQVRPVLPPKDRISVRREAAKDPLRP